MQYVSIQSVRFAACRGVNVLSTDSLESNLADNLLLLTHAKPIQVPSRPSILERFGISSHTEE